MTKIFLIAASTAVLAAVPALADHHGGGDEAKTRAEVEAKIAERFGKADANKDGAVTAAEFAARQQARHAEMQAKMSEMHTRMFERLDGDKNGQISKSEWDAHRAAMQTKMEERRETAGTDGKRVEKQVMTMEHGDGGKPMRMMRGHGGGWGEKWFEKADANNDGRVTLAEAKAKPLEHFDKMDVNKDGSLSADERKAAREKMREHHRAKRDS